MRTLAAVSVAALLAACTVPDTQLGSIYQANGETVTIRGAYSFGGGPAKPTPAMVAQAVAYCPGAEYLSANPSPTDDYTFLFLFRC